MCKKVPINLICTNQCKIYNFFHLNLFNVHFTSVIQFKCMMQNHTPVWHIFAQIKTFAILLLTLSGVKSHIALTLRKGTYRVDENGINGYNTSMDSGRIPWPSFCSSQRSRSIIVWLIAALLKFKVWRVFCVMFCILFVWVVNWFLHLSRTCAYSLQSLYLMMNGWGD